MLKQLAKEPHSFLALIPNLTILHVVAESSLKRVFQIASLRVGKTAGPDIKPIKRVIVCGCDRETLLPHSHDLEKEKLVPEIVYTEDEVSVLTFF